MLRRRHLVKLCAPMAWVVQGEGNTCTFGERRGVVEVVRLGT